MALSFASMTLWFRCRRYRSCKTTWWRSGRSWNRLNNRGTSRSQALAWYQRTRYRLKSPPRLLGHIPQIQDHQKTYLNLLLHPQPLTGTIPNNNLELSQTQSSSIHNQTPRRSFMISQPWWGVDKWACRWLFLLVGLLVIAKQIQFTTIPSSG